MQALRDISQIILQFKLNMSQDFLLIHDLKTAIAKNTQIYLKHHRKFTYLNASH